MSDRRYSDEELAALWGAGKAAGVFVERIDLPAEPSAALKALAEIEPMLQRLASQTRFGLGTEWEELARRCEMTREVLDIVRAALGLDTPIVSFSNPNGRST
jgi:hypothetical protein